MAKITTSISIDTYLHDLSRQKKGFILSHFVEEQLKSYFDMDQKELDHIKSIELLKEELSKQNAKMSIIKEKIKEKEEKNTKKHTKIEEEEEARIRFLRSLNQ